MLGLEIDGKSSDIQTNTTCPEEAGVVFGDVAARLVVVLVWESREQVKRKVCIISL